MPTTWGQRPQYGEFKISGAAEGHPKLLGEGSFGKTFEAVREDSVAGNVIEERVALKVLNPELLNSESGRSRFIREHFAFTRLRHANLIHLNACGEDNGEVYFAMDLCMGGDLVRLVKRFGALPERVVALIGRQVAAGLLELHRLGMMHRDIKPQNIMLCGALPGGCTLDDLTLLLEENASLCRIVDFGLAGMMLGAQGDGGHGARQQFVGSAMYASPEQLLERKDIDGRTDIYALGMTLWYLVQGRGPLLDARGDELRHAVEAANRHLSSGEHEPDLPHHLSPEFRGILARMVAKRAEERMPGARELAAELERYLERTARARGALLGPVQAREPLEAFFQLNERILNSIDRRQFLVENRSARRVERLTIVEEFDDHETLRPDFNEAVKKVFALAQSLREPGVPAAVLPVHEVVWAADALAYTEDVPGGVTLAEVLQARLAAKRPFSFREAEVIFRPIAEALDYLIIHGWELVDLPCEDVWLSDSVSAMGLHDREGLCRPLNERAGLRVRFSGMWVPPRTRKEDALAEITFGGAEDTSLFAEEPLRPPASAFLRLVYRTLSGSDVPDAADRWRNGYIPFASLQNSSNHLIRDILCKQREWSSVSLILNELCANEGVSVDAPLIPGVAGESRTTRSRPGVSRHVAAGSSGTAPLAGTPLPGISAEGPKQSSTGSSSKASETDADQPTPREAREAESCEVVSPGVVRLRGRIQELKPLEWATREFIRCKETGQWFFLPAESRGMFPGRVERLKHVMSPYSGKEQEVEWTDWVPGREIICAATHLPFVLPHDLPQPTGLDAPNPGRVSSPFAEGAPITVASDQWVPGDRGTCPETRRKYLLPEPLPHLEAMEELRFTLFRPREMTPNTWMSLLVFTHVAEIADEVTRRPSAQKVSQIIRNEAKAILGPEMVTATETTQDACDAIARGTWLRLVPKVDGVEFNPPERSFRWWKDVHREDFDVRADGTRVGSVCRGNITVYRGLFVLADIPVNLRIVSECVASESAEREPSVSPYKKVFASYSHRDLRIVSAIEQAARALGDEFLRDWVNLRAGEQWSQRLKDMIEQADVFQVFWSSNSSRSPHVLREVSHALGLARPNFIRPTYWEQPLPGQERMPDELRKIHFQRIDLEVFGVGASELCPSPESSSADARQGRSLMAVLVVVLLVIIGIVLAIIRGFR